MNTPTSIRIEKKVQRSSFEALERNEKTCEIRLRDFDLQQGDTLVLKEWDSDNQTYTGREISKVVSHIELVDIRNWHWTLEDIEKQGLQIISLR